MNKKGQFAEARKSIYWILAGIVITAVVIVFAFLVGSHKSRLTNVPRELPAELISLRFTSIPECFAFQDSNGRVYPGVIDLEKFTEEQLERCYPVDSREDFNFALSLDGKTIKTKEYFNVENFIINRKVLVNGDLKNLVTIVQEPRG